MSDYGKVSNFVLLNAVRISDRIADSCYNCRTFPRWTYFPFILINEATEVFRFNCYQIHTVHISSAVCSRTLNLGEAPECVPACEITVNCTDHPENRTVHCLEKHFIFLSLTHTSENHIWEDGGFPWSTAFITWDGMFLAQAFLMLTWHLPCYDSKFLPL